MRDLEEKSREELIKAVIDLRRQIADQHDAQVEQRRKQAELDQKSQLVVLNVAEPKRVEDQLQLIDFFVEHAGEAVFWLSADMEFIYANKAACLMLGYSRDELLTMSLGEIDEWFPAEAWPDVWEKMKAGESTTLLSRHRAKDGTVIPVDINGTYVTFDGREYCCAFVRDMTHRNRTEEALRASERRFSLAFNASPIPISISTIKEGRFIDVNHSFTRVTGFSREELIGRTGSSLDIWVNPQEREGMLQSLQNAGSVRDMDVLVRLKSGEIRSALVSIEIIELDGERCLLIATNDITERKQAEEALRQSEERYRSIIEDMHDGYYEMDLKGNLTFANDALCQLHKRSREELIGTNNRDYMDAETAERVFSLYKQVYLSGEPVRGFVWKRTRPDDGERWFEFSASLMKDASGKPSGFRGISRDITRRIVDSEALQNAKEAAEAASRAKSEFLANMSHEIRTPMNGIIGMTDLTLETPLSAEQRDYLNMVKDSAAGLLSIINDILDFSKIEAGKLDLDPLNFYLRDCIGNTINAFKMRALQKNLRLALHIVPEAPDLLVGDLGRLRQIITNLVGNAVKFTSSGDVVIHVTVDEFGFDDVLLHFAITDTGIGIPADKQQAIFDAFSQVDGSITRRYGGTGLGLAIASELVRMMGGAIWVESQPGMGSTFHFTARFGAKEEAANPAPVSAVNYQRVRKEKPGLHILLAEDNVVNQRLATRLLEKEGHSVVLVSDGRQAVAAFESESFDLILMDVQMPEINGYDATAAIREIEKAGGGHILIIAMTAHAMKGDRERCLEAGMDGYVSKPIKSAELFDTIEELTSVGLQR